LVADALPTVPTGQTGPCEDDPSRACNIVSMPKDILDQIRKSKLAALIRDTQGSAAFKQSLNGHLEQKSNNSDLDLALAAAAGVFDDNRADPPTIPRMLIWLTDGDVPESSKMRGAPLLAELRKGVAIRT